MMPWSLAIHVSITRTLERGYYVLRARRLKDIETVLRVQIV